MPLSATRLPSRLVPELTSDNFQQQNRVLWKRVYHYKMQFDRSGGSHRCIVSLAANHILNPNDYNHIIFIIGFVTKILTLTSWFNFKNLLLLALIATEDCNPRCIYSTEFLYIFFPTYLIAMLSSASIQEAAEATFSGDLERYQSSS